MNLTKSEVLIGAGRLSCAVARGGQLIFFIDTEGAIIRKSMPEGRRGLKNEGIVSYADDYTETAAFTAARFGGGVEVGECPI